MYTFSGIDSSGKTTQIELLQRYCKEHNNEAYYIWGKGRATPGVLFLKEVFRKDKTLNPEQKQAYRQKIYNSKKKKFLLLTASIIDLWWFWGIYYRYLDRKHEILICDRYVWDTYIDFKTEFYEFDVDKWLIWKIAKAIAPNPKHSFIFYITAEESFKRDNEKGDADRDDLDRKRKKVAKYKKLINEGKWDTVVDGMMTKEDMFNIVKNVIFNNK